MEDDDVERKLKRDIARSGRFGRSPARARLAGAPPSRSGRADANAIDLNRERALRRSSVGSPRGQRRS